jgi:hypothetical protein
MINKYTSYIIVLQYWNTAAREYPTERKTGPHCKKMLKTTDIDGKGLMVVQRAVWDNRRKVLPTVSRNVGVEA